MTDCNHDFSTPAVAAFTYAQLGWGVFPLAAGTKAPHKMLATPGVQRGSGGVHLATGDPGQIRSWWQADPAAGVGVTGGLFIDLDVKANIDGPGNWLAALERRGKRMPPAPRVSTPSGGTHLWLAPCEIRGRKDFLPGVDIKGWGGYVVAPPSHLVVRFAPRANDPGGRANIPYQWRYGCPCQAPPAPEWLSAWITERPGGVTPSGTSYARGEPANIAELLQTGLPVGARNTTLHKACCQLYGREGTMPGSAAEGVIRKILAATDISGFWPDEVDTIMDSAARWVTAQREAEDWANQQTWQNTPGWLLDAVPGWVDVSA